MLADEGVGLAHLVHARAARAIFLGGMSWMRVTHSSVPLRLGEFHAFEDELEHGRRNGVSIGVAVEMETSPLQTFEEEAEPGGIPKDHL